MMTDPGMPPAGRRARIAVLDDYMGVADSLADWTILSDRADVVFLRHHIAMDRLTTELAPYDALCLLRERSAFPASVIENLPNLKAIATTGRRTRTLDADTAARRGITLMKTEDGGNGMYATVELAWGLVLSLLRHIPAESAAMRDGAWQSRLGSALFGRTLGLVGLGRLGSRMALVAKAFGMKVIAWSPNLTPARAADAGVDYCDKETLFSTADIVSLHIVLGPTTKGIVGASDIALMKPDALLINTSRGPLVDQDALIDALANKRIGGAGIDVYDMEPLPADSPIRRQPNLLATPHLGYVVRETFENYYRQTVENLDAWLDGHPIRLLEKEAS